MSDSDDTSALDEPGENSPAVSGQAFSSNYKVLGYEQSGSGTTYGVLGQVDSADGFGLGTPDDAWVGSRLKTTHVKTDDQDLTLEFGTVNASDASNLIAGHTANGVTSGVVGATISGGGYSDGGTVTAEDIDPNTDANLVFDNYGSVGGGRKNRAGSYDQGVTLGEEETGDDVEPADVTSSPYATVSGGRFNGAGGKASTVGGGQSNVAAGDFGTIAGGKNSNASSKASTVAGGQANEALGQYATVGGGHVNKATGEYATIAGGGPPGDLSGTRNDVHDNFGTIGGGGDNNAGAASTSGTTNAVFATVPGGRANVADGSYSFAAGRAAEAGGNDGAFVWGDSSTTTVTAGGTDEVRFQASGGFTIANTEDVQIAAGLPSGSGTPVEIDSNGNLFANAQVSSRRYKTDIEPLAPESGTLLDLEPRSFTYEETGESDVGLIAEEVDDAVPDLAFDDEQGRPEGVRYDRLAVFLLPEVRRSHDRIEALESETEQLRAENEDLRERLDALEEQVGGSDAGADVSEPAPADD